MLDESWLSLRMMNVNWIQYGAVFTSRILRMASSGTSTITQRGRERERERRRWNPPKETLTASLYHPRSSNSIGSTVRHKK